MLCKDRTGLFWGGLTKHQHQDVTLIQYLRKWDVQSFRVRRPHKQTITLYECCIYLVFESNQLIVWQHIKLKVPGHKFFLSFSYDFGMYIFLNDPNVKKRKGLRRISNPLFHICKYRNLSLLQTHTSSREIFLKCPHLRILKPPSKCLQVSIIKADLCKTF